MNYEEEQDARQEIALAAEAKAILENPLFKEAFNAIRADLMAQWQASGLEESNLRENVFTAIKITEKVENCLVKTIESGTLANVSLLELEKAKSRHFKEK